jgi:predicted metalloprotease
MRLAPMGIGGAIIVLVLSLLLGRDVGTGPSTTSRTTGGEVVAPAQESPAEAREAALVSFVLDTAQSTWSQVLPSVFGVPWQDAKLVLYRQATPTACGIGQAGMGPFYCPLDQRVYIDLSFYDDLRSRFGAPGEFAEAYVLTHELGHHVQHLLGTDQLVRRAQQANPDQANALSVALELQADCYSGIWAHYTKSEQILEPGDIEQGLAAAAAVGDDRLQRATTGQVDVDSFTHGSSAQRVAWFRRGFESGNPKDCDTFASWERGAGNGR